MRTDAAWQTISKSPQDTENLGASLARGLKGGEVIELASDLGGGKTTFVRGLVGGLNSSDKVASPTFTISKIYKAGELEVHHFDFYRLPEAGIIADELAEVIGDPKIIVIVEWAEAVHHVLPDNRLTVNIRQLSDGNRNLTFTCPASLDYLIKSVER